MLRALCLLCLSGLSLYGYGEPVYRIAVPDYQYKPLYWLDSTHQFQGPMRDSLDQFAALHKLKFEYIPVPRKRMLSALLNAEVDFRLPDNPDWAKDAKLGNSIIYSEPLLAYKEGALVLERRENLTLNKVKTLAVLRGFSPLGYQKHGITTLPMADMNALFNMVSSARVDAGFVNFNVARLYLAQPIGRVLALSETLPQRQGYYHLSSVRHGELLRQLNRFLNGKN